MVCNKITANRLLKDNGGKNGGCVWGIGRTKEEAEAGFVKSKAFKFVEQEANRKYEDEKAQMAQVVKILTDVYAVQRRVMKSKKKK